MTLPIIPNTFAIAKIISKVYFYSTQKTTRIWRI